jgi:hypothetical protein
MTMQSNPRALGAWIFALALAGACGGSDQEANEPTQPVEPATTDPGSTTTPMDDDDTAPGTGPTDPVGPSTGPTDPTGPSTPIDPTTTDPSQPRKPMAPIPPIEPTTPDGTP